MNKFACVFVGGGIGALLRYLVQGWAQERWGASFPSGTLLVNITGAFLIGMLMTIFLEHVEIAPQWRIFLVIGILGGYTTFSSLTWEAYQLFASGSTGQGLIYLGGSFFGGFAGLFLGVVLGRLI